MPNQTYPEKQANLEHMAAHRGIFDGLEQSIDDVDSQDVFRYAGVHMVIAKAAIRVAGGPPAMTMEDGITVSLPSCISTSELRKYLYEYGLVETIASIHRRLVTAANVLAWPAVAEVTKEIERMLTHAFLVCKAMDSQPLHCCMH
ncbi:hypothetical protein [Sinorhizobium sp. BJ1]|uniref:hypothetical protein n=1 Tax=Sinorhizobium sp. BJ1 TaxID=2035455 RepID=UPI000BE93317|nr:hypothetical protein [Sinorhizobium sp. BJ1]PDT81857.1 hypothetical protein CO676_20045 [Sinorhizobium sp. BJ1]